MELIECPECKQKLSDMVENCPVCGCTLVQPHEENNELQNEHEKVMFKKCPSCQVLQKSFEKTCPICKYDLTKVVLFYDKPEFGYVAFWPRAWATLIDTFFIMIIILPPLVLAYGWAYFRPEEIIRGPIDALVGWILPVIAVWTFWHYKSATPGKMIIKAKIVDAKTGRKPTSAQLIIRYYGYFVSMIPFCIGFFSIPFDHRKQGWHDKLSGTLVIHTGPKTIRKEKSTDSTAPA